MRLVKPDGSYALAAGESLKSVRLIYRISSSAMPATLAGQFSSNSKSWSSAVGDFELISYQIEFVVQRNGQQVKYLTQQFTYGR
jgi:hypothetical protein